MIRGVATDVVSSLLHKLPSAIRRVVKTVTTDLSSAMMLTVWKVFPHATLINDRFHVQQLMSEAVDRMRIRLRWQVLEEENKALREHRAGRKAAKSRTEREAIGQWEPHRMDNGETMPQIMARSRHIILKHESKWNGQQRKRAEVLFKSFPKLKEAYGLSMRLTELFNKKSTPAQARLNLARWYNEVETFGENEFARVLETFENHNGTIINYFEERLTNASAESFNAKIKAFRAQFRGVGDIRFFMFRQHNMPDTSEATNRKYPLTPDKSVTSFLTGDACLILRSFVMSLLVTNRLVASLLVFLSRVNPNFTL